MRWVLLDVVLALLALALLAAVALGLWRRVRALGRAVAVASSQLEAVGAQLDSVGRTERPFIEPTPAGHVPHGRRATSGVRSTGRV